MLVRLGDFLEELSAKTIRNNQYPVLTSSKNGIFLQDDYFNKRVASRDTTGYKIIRRGEFTYRAMSDTGEFFPNMLECADVGIVSPAYPVFKISKDIVLPDYLKYYFKSEYFQKSIAPFVQGSTRSSIKFNKLKAVTINLPTKKVQKEIVRKLDITTEQIKLRLRDIELMDKLIKARFVEMFFNKYQAFVVGEKLRTVSGGTPSKKHPEYYENGTIPWLTSGEVGAGTIRNTKNKITEDAVKNSSAKMVPENSVLVAMYGATAGQVGLLKVATTTNQAVCSILPNNNYLPEYLYYAISQKKGWMTSQCAGGAQPNISQAIIRKMELVDAPIESQRVFVHFANQVDKSKFVLRNKLAVRNFYICLIDNCVVHRSVDLRMSQKFLHLLDRHPFINSPGRHCSAELVWVNFVYA